MLISDINIKIRLDNYAYSIHLIIIISHLFIYILDYTGPKRSWAIVEVKDLKLSNQIRDNTNPRQKTDLVSRSMVTFDRGSPTNAGNNSRRHQNSHHNNQNKTTNSAYDVHQSKYFRTNHNQQIQSGANIVKPIIKGFNTNSSMKSASTNELHVHLPSSQSTTSFPNAPNRRISSAMGKLHL